jgi:hypothetical protein
MVRTVPHQSYQQLPPTVCHGMFRSPTVRPVRPFRKITASASCQPTLDPNRRRGLFFTSTIHPIHISHRQPPILQSILLVNGTHSLSVFCSSLPPPLYDTRPAPLTATQDSSTLATSPSSSPVYRFRRFYQHHVRCRKNPAPRLLGLGEERKRCRSGLTLHRASLRWSFVRGSRAACCVLPWNPIADFSWDDSSPRLPFSALPVASASRFLSSLSSTLS